MFVLIATLFISGLAETPKVITHDFKTKAACETAARILEQHTEESGLAKILWQCVPK